jgi:GNAT superfamily N-acetyltransferase
MTAQPRLIDVTAENFDCVPCCGIKNAAHPGRRAKRAWLEANLRYGLRAKTLVAPDGQACGYIEYIPGEYAWRAVEAAGYMFVHCLWMFVKKHQGKGWTSLMLEACVDDAKRGGMHGVATLTRKSAWLAGSAVYVKNGFTVVGEAAPDYQLLAKKFEANVPDPRIRRNERAWGGGLTIIRSGQCPHIDKFAGDIADCAEQEYSLRPEIVALHSHMDAQSAPTPYAVFEVIRDGVVVADHQISRTRFCNIMEKANAPRDARGIRRTRSAPTP